MSKLKVLYLYRRPVSKDLKKAREGEVSHDLFFGYSKLSGEFNKDFTEKIFSNKFILAIDQLIIKATYPFMKIGFSLFSVIYQLPELRRADVLFATTDSFGLPLLLLRYVRIINKPIIINTGGFFDGFKESRSKIYKKFVKSLFSNVTFIVSGVANECKLIAKELDLPKQKTVFIPYGVDTEYFAPKTHNRYNPDQDFVLTVGADFKRDWISLKKVINNLPKTKFIIITAPDQLKIKMPPNAKILYNLPLREVRTYIRNALLIVILSKQNYRFAGSSTILRAMSCGKTVIFTESFGLSEQPFVNHKDAILVPPNNATIVLSEIKRLINYKSKISEIGKNARKYVLKNNNYEDYTLRLENFFKKSTFNEKIN